MSSTSSSSNTMSISPYRPLTVPMYDLDPVTAASLSPDIPLNRNHRNNNNNLLSVQDWQSIRGLSSFSETAAVIQSEVVVNDCQKKNKNSSSSANDNINDDTTGGTNPVPVSDSPDQSNSENNSRSSFLSDGCRNYENRTESNRSVYDHTESHCTESNRSTFSFEGESEEKLPNSHSVVCRVCHYVAEGEEEEEECTNINSVLILQCGCRKDMAVTHRECARMWFTYKGDRVCEICSEEVSNLPPLLPQNDKDTETETDSVSLDLFPYHNSSVSPWPLQLRENIKSCLHNICAFITFGTIPCLDTDHIDIFGDTFYSDRSF